MANYGVTNSTLPAGVVGGAMTTTYKTILAVGASSNSGAVATGLRRGRIYDILIGTNGTAANNSMEWDVVQGTLTNVVATPTWAGSVSSVSSAYALDMADIGFSASVVMNASAETNAPAGAEKWYVGVNQQASYRWVAIPGSELVYPAVSSGTGNNALGLRARSAAYTGTATGNIMFSE